MGITRQDGSKVEFLTKKEIKRVINKIQKHTDSKEVESWVNDSSEYKIRDYEGEVIKVIFRNELMRCSLIKRLVGHTRLLCDSYEDNKRLEEIERNKVS